MTHIRIHYKVLGGHVHCRVFSGPASDLTHGKNGDLVFDEREWPAVRDMLYTRDHGRLGVEFIDETEKR